MICALVGLDMAAYLRVVFILLNMLVNCKRFLPLREDYLFEGCDIKDNFALRVTTPRTKVRGFSVHLARKTIPEGSVQACNT